MQFEERTIILLARHGECRGNVEGLFRGRVDFPLNENGLRQAHALGNALCPFQPIVVATSPLLRAKSTAEIIGEACSAPVIVDEGFTNTALGIWEGRPKTEIAREYPEQWKIWLENPEKLSVEGAESMDNALHRSMASLDRLVEKYRGKTVVAVTHRTVIKPLLAGCLGIRSPFFWKVHMDTAAYSVLTFDDLHGYSLFSLNRTDHLSEFTTEWI